MNFHHWNDDMGIDDLIKSALREHDDDKAWVFVQELQKIGTAEVLICAAGLSHSEDPKERCLAANILGQLGVPDRTYPKESIDILIEMLQGEQEPIVLEAIAVALGHQDTERAVDALYPIRNHPDAQVRLGVTFGILQQDAQTAIDMLLSFMNDNDDEIRDWATFGIGSMLDIDTPAIREALYARVRDNEADVRAEAIVGLAIRKDARIVQTILDQLSEAEFHPLIVDAAAEMADNRFHPALLALQKTIRGKNKDNFLDQNIERAIQACSDGGAYSVGKS